ncbi:IS110 family transposase [Legionella busanensis]|nr:IS110 family transposase [Legionella busanensis]
MTAIRHFFAPYKHKQITLCAFEATGGYEKKLIDCYEELRLPYRMLHANHIRAYAKALGILAKTDKLDAKVIHDYAMAVSVDAVSSKNENQDISDLLNRREQLTAMRIEESNRLETMTNKVLIKSFKAHIKWIEKQVDTIEAQLVECVNRNDSVKFLFELYTSIPGIGLITALRLIADLPELLTHTDKQLAALIGIAPMNNDSGKMRGYRRIIAGRAKIRRLLYLATISAIKCNPLIKSFYNKLKSKGKPGKVAIIASSRKLLTVLRSKAQNKIPWVSIFS